MKNKRLSLKLLSLILLVCYLVILPFPVATSAVDEKPDSYYTPLNGYFYQLDRKMTSSVDSFEAWIKLPVSSFGGTIFNEYKKKYVCKLLFFKHDLF